MDVLNSFAAPVRSLVLLAPSGAPASRAFARASANFPRFTRLQQEMQRLRGRVYQRDGAVAPGDLTSDGRHVLASDDHSWHLLTIDSAERVVGCARYLQHTGKTRFEDLRMSASAQAQCPIWGPRLRAAVEEELSLARNSGFSYVEMGGWAMDKSIRCTTECLRSVLASYAWSRIVGGAIGISTATERNGSASILRRLGGRSLEWNGIIIPPYYDPRYKCGMQMLRYDSRMPNQRYEATVEELQRALLNVQVICPEKPRKTFVSGYASLMGVPIFPPESAGIPAALVHAA